MPGVCTEHIKEERVLLGQAEVSKVGRASEKAFGRRHVSRALHDDHKEVIRQKFQRSCFKQRKSWILQGATGSLLPLSAELQEEC